MLKTHKFIVAGLCVALLPCLALNASAATVNGFANGGFEIAGANPPAAQSWVPAASGYTRSTDAHTGDFSAQLMSPALNAAIMLQNSVEDGGLAPLTAGDTPQLSFWAKGFAGDTGNVNFALRYLDPIGNILANSGPQFFQGAINTSTWTEITYSLGAVPVGASAAFIEFAQAIGPIGLDPPSGNILEGGTVLIDDVYLGVAAPPIPEPTSFALLGLAGLALASRRKR